MLVFATSDKGGTGRSVTSANLAYRRALQGSDVAYLDFDFGSPTAGTIFMVPAAERGTSAGGLHSFLGGSTETPTRLDVWAASERPALRSRPSSAGQLVLYPGDSGGGEFAADADMIRRCVRLFLRLEEEFDLCLIDLSAGRSHATEIALAATASAELAATTARWLVFHRWTRQHIIAAAGLVHGAHGLLLTGKDHGHDPARLLDSIRFVRTAVVDPDSDVLAGLRPEQVLWLRGCNEDLQRLASEHGVGRLTTIGSVPLDPVLQWREQLISDTDVVTRRAANQETVAAFEEIAAALSNDDAWTSL